MMRFARSLSVFFLPGGLIVLAAFLTAYFNLVSPWLAKIEKIIPYVILAIGVILAWRFHRSRLVFIIFILFLSERSLYYFGLNGLITTEHGSTIPLIVGVLLPVNIALFYLVKEKNIFTLGTLVRLFFLLLQPLVIYLVLRSKPELLNYLSYQFIRNPYLDALPLPQPVLLVNFTIIMIFLAGSLFARSVIVRGYFWTLVACLAGLVARPLDHSPTIYFTAAGLIIIAAVIETAYAMAFHDELTGLPARRALNTALHGLGKRYSIAMLDIDFFKKFNDRFGHDVGDQVLCMVASHLRRVGGGGRSFRYGGEEFTILFSGKTKEEAIPYLEMVRQSIEAAQFALRGKNRPKTPPKKMKKSKEQPRTVSVTISIGVAEPKSGKDKPHSVIKAADSALYRAKKRGRNCIAS